LKTLYPILWDVGVFLAPYSELISWFLFLNSDDMDEYVQDFVVRYAIPCSLYTHCFAQYLDFLVHQTNREFWKNDPSHATDVVAPEPYPGDGYYYYLENMENVSIPTIAVLSEFDSLVVADEIIEHLMEGKTPDASDEYYIIPDTAHIDIVMGLKAPTITFPFIGDWLDKICQ
jgi:hypothetical protein